MRSMTMYKSLVHSKAIKLTSALIFLLSLLYLGSCNSVNNAVEDALKTTSFKLSALDQVAANILSDSTVATAFKTQTAAFFDTTSDTTGTNYYRITFPDNKVDTIPQNDYATLLDSLNSKKVTLTVLDTAYKVVTGTPKISGMKIASGDNEKLVFYITDYVIINLIKRNGTEIIPTSKAIPTELSANCFTLKNNKPDPKIKTRIEYDVAANTDYLLLIIRNDQTLSKTFFVAVLGE